MLSKINMFEATKLMHRLICLLIKSNSAKKLIAGLVKRYTPEVLVTLARKTNTQARHRSKDVNNLVKSSDLAMST
jgi:hypothetical protein